MLYSCQSYINGRTSRFEPGGDLGQLRHTAYMIATKPNVFFIQCFSRLLSRDGVYGAHFHLANKSELSLLLEPS
ncbi:hypothetical protein KIN20_001636 [Parelaphostrongylus tenuis]|uniref:Uncharacterized protein n=1 Tax=Parelaphostrongylus tenuis TaxID=148309 RepID=A0AAD5QCF6_PARTN|nr:hypothetical protein KIN20_001636 [Parelaphostrongylus tenuis]